MSERKILNDYIFEKYNTKPEFPWIKYPGFAVYRHSTNNKWFAVMMNIPKSKLGLENNEEADIINLKCDPLMIGSLCFDEGIFPAYQRIGYLCCSTAPSRKPSLNGFLI